MPVSTAAACVPTADCPATAFPVATANCSCTTSPGGVNDLYFIPCDQVMSETNILNTTWWENLLTSDSSGSGGGSALGNMGAGLGSIAKKTDKKERLSSCKVEQVISTTWALKYVLKCFDKSTDKVTHEQINALIASSRNYQLIARMCDGDNTVLPIGGIALSDFNWIVPDNFEELQTIELELSWIELGLPKTYNVTGLSAIIPKAA
jgi:hypothetical protein